MDINHIIQDITIMAMPLIFAITLHEAAHGWMANKWGDPTARLAGRLTLNPLVHIDLFGTIILPLMIMLLQIPVLFGYAKPVPVNFRNLRDPKKGMIWVAGSGPGINLIIAIISGLLFRFIIKYNPYLLFSLNKLSWLGQRGDIATSFLVPLLLMLEASVKLNVLLMAFNLIPIPPLDGGRILVGLLPGKLSDQFSKIESYGMIILMVLIMIDPLGIMRHILWPLVSLFTSYILGEIKI